MKVWEVQTFIIEPTNPWGFHVFDGCGCDQEIYWCWLWSLAELLGGAMAAGVFRLLRREEFTQAKQNCSNPQGLMEELHMIRCQNGLHSCFCLNTCGFCVERL